MGVGSEDFRAWERKAAKWPQKSQGQRSAETVDLSEALGLKAQLVASLIPGQAILVSLTQLLGFSYLRSVFGLTDPS